MSNANVTMFVTMTASLSSYEWNSKKCIHLNHSIKLRFRISSRSEYVQSLSAKNLLVWDKNLRRGFVGTSERCANLNDNNKSVRESIFLFPP